MIYVQPLVRVWQVWSKYRNHSKFQSTKGPLKGTLSLFVGAEAYDPRIRSSELTKTGPLWSQSGSLHETGVVRDRSEFGNGSSLHELPFSSIITLIETLNACSGSFHRDKIGLGRWCLKMEVLPQSQNVNAILVFMGEPLVFAFLKSMVAMVYWLCTVLCESAGEGSIPSGHPTKFLPAKY